MAPADLATMAQIWVKLLRHFADNGGCGRAT